MSDEDGNRAVTGGMGMPDGHPTTTEVRVELDAVGGRTKMVMTHVGIPADSPGAAGWTMAFDKLAAHIAAHVPSRSGRSHSPSPVEAMFSRSTTTGGPRRKRRIGLLTIEPSDQDADRPERPARRFDELAPAADIAASSTEVLVRSTAGPSIYCAAWYRAVRVGRAGVL